MPEMSVDDLATLPMEEAADQISNLAGFTEEDLALLNGGDGMAEDVQLPAPFPAPDLDLSDLE